MKPITARDILEQLNKLLEDDREAVQNLVELRVDCTRLEFTHKNLVPHKSNYMRSLAGLVEILNCLIYPSAAIIPVYNPRGELLRFKLTVAKERNE